MAPVSWDTLRAASLINGGRGDNVLFHLASRIQLGEIWTSTAYANLHRHLTHDRWATPWTFLLVSSTACLMEGLADVVTAFCGFDRFDHCPCIYDHDARLRGAQPATEPYNQHVSIRCVGAWLLPPELVELWHSHARMQ